MNHFKKESQKLDESTSHQTVSAVEAERPVESGFERAAVADTSENTARGSHAVAHEAVRTHAAHAVQLVRCNQSLISVQLGNVRVETSEYCTIK